MGVKEIHQKNIKKNLRCQLSINLKTLTADNKGNVEKFVSIICDVQTYFKLYRSINVKCNNNEICSTFLLDKMCHEYLRWWTNFT